MINSCEILYPFPKRLYNSHFTPGDMDQGERALIFSSGGRERGYSGHSVRKLFAGLATAAFIAWKPIVSNAISIADEPAARKTDQPMGAR